jgi:hypothetical protein
MIVALRAQSGVAEGFAVCANDELMQTNNPNAIEKIVLRILKSPFKN